jgi:hypothetical protein
MQKKKTARDTRVSQKRMAPPKGGYSQERESGSESWGTIRRMIRDDNPGHGRERYAHEWLARPRVQRLHRMRLVLNQ